MLSILFVIMMIIVLAKAMFRGEENELLTNITMVVGIVTTVLNILLACLGVLPADAFSIILTAVCLIFAALLKKIVKFFVDDYDKKHQIPAEELDKMRRFDEETARGEQDFWDEDQRFNGKFKDYDELE